MFVAGNFLIGIGQVIDMVLSIYMWIVIIRALISWVRPDPYNPIVKILNGLVDPVTYRIARIIPTRFGMLDVAPLVLILAIYFLRFFLVQALIDAGARMR
jgi:YggT family protein